MNNSRLVWSADASQVPSISSHTLAKHQILFEYVKHLILTLYGKVFPHGVTSFTFVDGFCGGGIYFEDASGEYKKGSPIILIEAVREAFREANRVLPINVRYIFIDSEEQHVKCLKEYSMNYWNIGCLTDESEHIYRKENAEMTERCNFISGSFEEISDYCVLTANLRKGHSFFLLDPAGWDDISVKTIRKINDIPGSEILYTYMLQSLKRFVIGRSGKDRDKFNKILEAEKYYKKSDLDSLDKIGEQMYLRNETAMLFRENGFTESNKDKYLITFARA